MVSDHLVFNISHQFQLNFFNNVINKEKKTGRGIRSISAAFQPNLIKGQFQNWWKAPFPDHLTTERMETCLFR